jgi:hypothetical protein
MPQMSGWVGGFEMRPFIPTCPIFKELLNQQDAVHTALNYQG